MGNAVQTPKSFPDTDTELKVFRQLRAEFSRKAAETQDEAALMSHMKQAYETLTSSYANAPAYNADGSVVKVPTVRFGKTELAMPVVSMGCMRFQQTWQPWESFALEDVEAACQANLEAILERAFQLGINHVETARGYGSSELQLGYALKKFDRASFILQTKVLMEGTHPPLVKVIPPPSLEQEVPPKATAAEFRAALEESFAKLQVERVDLMAFHGVNLDRHLAWVLGTDGGGGDGGCLAVAREYQAAGKIGHVGFSTHAMTPLIVQAIETGEFDYVNLHYQYVGSYTASGTGPATGGNLEAVRAARARDMGVFIISGADKGGKLYKPSKAFAAACMPDATPIAFNHLWLWAHEDPQAVHTIVVGPARPSDFDEAYASTLLYDRRKEISEKIHARLRAAADAALGDAGWMDTWWRGLPHVYAHPLGTHIPHLVWLWTLVKAWGMYDFARDRYAAIEGNGPKWDDARTPEENWEALGFNWVPGCGHRPGVDYAPHVAASPHADKIPGLLEEVHEWLRTENVEAQAEWRAEQGWCAAYDLQPDVPFPEKMPMPQQAALKKEKEQQCKAK